MPTSGWKQRLDTWRGVSPIERDLTPYRDLLAAVNREGESLAGATEVHLKDHAAALRTQARAGISPDELLAETFALVREVADRTLGLRPYDVQVMAGAALHRGRLVEMQTGEGKTLAAVLPACLNAWGGAGVHILTFNDYLARRDAAWMAPVYAFLGLRVAAIQEGMSTEARRDAYAADVTYATAKESGFDFLRMHLARSPEEVAHRPFHVALVDEADSLLIDEARVPLVIAGARDTAAPDLRRLASVIGALEADVEWETDEHARNVLLTERGYDRVEAALGCGDLHADANVRLLTEVNQALHAHVRLHRDVDYLVRDDRLELVDEFTGRVMDDRRWPDGLQAALEAKEGLPIQPGGQILGSITLPHFLRQYPRLSGMTATAQSAADEFEAVYGLKVVPIPPNRPCLRDDLPDVIFSHREAKEAALVREIQQAHAQRRPVLVGTRTVEESEALASRLREAQVTCRVLNARHDAAEAEIIAEAGRLGAVTIATNMAGRGTDIRLGGSDEAERQQVVALGGLYVIGTNRHESRRIDDQLRGRAGRQGDPGTAQFFVSLDDDLMTRFGIDALIPPRLRPAQDAPLDHPLVRREVERLQRIVEGQNHEIRTTSARYADLVEKQRVTLHAWRRAVLLGEVSLGVAMTHLPERYATWCTQVDTEVVEEAERAITLHHIDQAWADHLAFVADLREGIHLVGIGGLDPLHEFHKQVAEAFSTIHATIEADTAASLASLDRTTDGLNLGGVGLGAPSATWTYLVNDRALSDLQAALFGKGSSAFSAGAALTAWPLLLGWGLWRRFKKTSAE
ncbi:MAG: accessory Sec system translocase SecA2 [Rhodothermaceae bacterium]|nr:accessory Sec system translocase SecA2 [Rhodothermaceae bacterium]